MATSATTDQMQLPLRFLDPAVPPPRASPRRRRKRRRAETQEQLQLSLLPFLERYEKTYSSKITLEQCLALHEFLLERSLSAIPNHRIGMRTLEEIRAWIEEPLRKGRLRAFSFQACCLAAGLDPEVMQEQALKQLCKRLEEADVTTS